MTRAGGLSTGWTSPREGLHPSLSLPCESGSHSQATTQLGLWRQIPSASTPSTRRTDKETMAEDKPTYSLAARCAAEAVGTFTIVAGGCGAVSAARYAGGPPIAASAFAGSVMIGVYATGNVSGAHLNPAVTAACVATSKPGPCTGEEGLCYAASQTVGAFLAACCNFGMYKTGIRALESRKGAPEARAGWLIIPVPRDPTLFLTKSARRRLVVRRQLYC